MASAGSRVPAAGRSPRNRTIVLSEEERERYGARLIRDARTLRAVEAVDLTIQMDLFTALPLLPPRSVDLLFADPPYNIAKTFGEARFSAMDDREYLGFLESWLDLAAPLLKSDASLYVCGDWRSSGVIQEALSRRFIVRNRITWEREKGRGAARNWKNVSEDIWFATVSGSYVFNADAVRLRRKVMAPYRDGSGAPKDWTETADGPFRLTAASNLWTDITVPYWSMQENTEHPTQKPEKLLAKIILASSRPGALVLDPFLGSGTASVVAKKLGRHYIGIETDFTYACTAEKRLFMADADRRIQGYEDGVFLERNTRRTGL